MRLGPTCVQQNRLALAMIFVTLVTNGSAQAAIQTNYVQPELAVTALTNAPTYIVRLGRNWSVDKTIQWLHAKPRFVYRRACHGFALQMDTNTAARLRQAVATVPGISIVPSPAPSIVMLNSNADPNTVVKAMSLHPKFIRHYGLL